MDNKTRYEVLKTIRVEQPIVWAVLRGASTVSTIAKALLWTPNEVRLELEETPGIIEIANGTYGIDDDYIDADRFHELKGFASALFKSIARAQSGAKNQALTEKQRRTFEQISQLDQPFTTLQAAQAQGYSQAGFTKGQLESLERKGRVKKRPQTRPQLWVTIPE